MKVSLLPFFLTVITLCAPVIARVQHKSIPASMQGANSISIGYKMVKVRHTRILFPRLTRYRNETALKAVNRRIDELTKDFGCDLGDNNNYFEVRSRVEYAAKDIFSIYVSASYYCGGAYPTNDDNESLTFDLKTGKEVGFDQLFKDYEANKGEILRVIFAKQVERSNKLAAAGKPTSDDCEGDTELFSLEHLKESSYSYNFTRIGIAVQPSWAHVIEACAERVIIPYPKLKKFAAPQSILYRVMR